MALIRQALRTLDPGQLSVLIVDDNQHMRRIMLEVMRAVGVNRIYQAVDGSTGLAEMAIWKPSVIISDMQMEPMDGLELTRRVRHDLPWPDRATPIILVSSNSSPEHLQKARWSGIDEYVAKPFSTGAIMARLEEVMVRPRPFIQSPKFTGPCRRRRMLGDDYPGPRRRLDDPFDIEAPGDSADVVAKKAKINEGMEKIAKLAENLRPGDRLAVRAIYSGGKEAESIAIDIRDNLLERASQSLITYVEGIGASGRIDGAVVQTHIEAIQTLLKLPATVGEERDLVTKGLEMMVSKKLAQRAGI